MNARENIINRLRAVDIVEVTKPQVDIEPIRFDDRVAYFADMVKSVGGEVTELQSSLAKTLAALGVDTENLVSSLTELKDKALNPDFVADVHELGGDYTAVVYGKVAVAENGAVWVPVEGNRKAHLFACKHLVIVLDKGAIVDTMHEAIKRISLDDIAYGAFISGPSKTADIEQALVMGAHGAMKATIILT
jgi:L-lactate dehydrogenase complex protein LldG